MTQDTEIRTRADGSIDTAHYMARGREMRSLAFWAVLGKLRPQRRSAGPVAVEPTVKHRVKSTKMRAVTAPALPRALPAARTAL